MKKRLALLGLALIFVLGSVFGGAFAPLMANYIAEATSILHSADVANYSIEHLPKKSYQVGDLVPVDLPRTSTGVYYTLTRQVSENNIVWGVSHSNGDSNGTTGLLNNYTDLEGVEHGAHPGYDNKYQIGDQTGFYKFTLEGNYTYNFYSEAEYRKLELKGKNHIVTGGDSFHSYTITVLATNFTIELPENDKDIFPNVVTPNTEITLPLPSHLYDLKGRDLLDLDSDNKDAKEARREAYLPEMIATSSQILSGYTDKQLIEYFFDGTPVAGLDAPAAPITCATIVDWIYRDMRIVVYDYPDNQYYGNLNGIKNAADRKFTPTVDGRTCSAEYTYSNAHNNISASFSTSKINVERPYPANSGDITDANARNNVLLVTIPEISFTPSASSFRIGTETALPTATVSVHEDSLIQFDSASTLTNYTYIAVRYRPQVDNPNDYQWRWLGSGKDPVNGFAVILPEGTAENSSSIMRISDFKFTPERVGDYQFHYYTTTIFGVGNKNKVGDREAIPADRIHTFGGREYIKNQPFLNIKIERDNQTPEIKWTADYKYKTISGEMKPTGDEGATELIFEDAPDYSKMLPGTTSSSKTKIMKGEDLVVPALLGVDNATASHNLDYRLNLYRYQDGVRSSTYVSWVSGINGSDTNIGGGIWKHNETFRIPFTDASFNNSGAGGSSSSLLARFSGFPVIGKYDLTVCAYDDGNNISQQFQYTFEVVDPSSWTPSRPTLSGLFRTGQDEYHEGDTMVFSVARFADKYTNDGDIDTRYFISLDEGKDIERLLNNDTTDAGKAVEIKNGEEGITISGGIASFEINNNNAAGSYILGALDAVWEENETYTDGTVLEPGNPIIGTRKHEGFLSFRVYAIARNYHAMTKITTNAGGDDSIGYEVGRTYQYNSETTLDFSIENISAATVTQSTPNFMRAVFDTVTVFDMSYGGAAVITDKFGGDYTYNDVTGEATVEVGGGEPSWYEDDDAVFRLDDDKIAIPALRFFYPNEIGPLYSTISYSVTFDGYTKDTYSYNSQNKIVGGGWQGMLGATSITSADGPLPLPSIGSMPHEEGRTFGTDSLDETDQRAAGQRYFKPMGVGEHLITVKVTNAGGNVTVFIGKITVVGTPQATSRLLGARTTPMRVGESEKMPTVEVTIDNVKYVTGKIDASAGSDSLQGYIVTADVDPILNRPAKVGTFYIDFWSENESEYVPNNNGFTPLAVDTYWFAYVIEIRDNIEKYPAGHPLAGQDYHIIPNLDPNVRESIIDPVSGKVTPPIRRTETWTISVEPLQSTDLIIKLDGTPYNRLAQTSAGAIGLYYDKALEGTPNEIAFYDPREANTYNFFTDMLKSNATEDSIEMSDSQLLGGIEPFIPDDSVNPNAVPEFWQYGKIYVPNYLKQFADTVQGISDDFSKNAKGYITVTKSGTTLLDTRTDSDTATPNQIDGNLGADPYYWFRPTGLLVAQYDGDTSGQDLEWAMRNATNKNQWKAEVNAYNTYLKVDGKYEVTYTLEYMGVTVTKTYNIAMGDTQQPKITLADNSENNDKFSRTYKVGETFTFNTSELTVKGPKNTEIFEFEKGMDSWLANSYENPNFSIIITPYGGVPLSPTIIKNKIGGGQEVYREGNDDGHNYEIIIDEAKGTEQHTFTFNESGTYSIAFHVKSESGVDGTKEYRLTVEDKTPKSPIAPETVWGTILIILSIGLFLGVVIYFIRTGRQTKFVSSKTKIRKTEKEKESGDGGIV